MSSSGGIDILVYRPNSTAWKVSLPCYKELCDRGKYCGEQVYYRNISYLTTPYQLCMSFMDCIIKPTFIVHRSEASKCQLLSSQSNSSFITFCEIITLPVNSCYILHYPNITIVRSSTFLYSKKTTKKQQQQKTRIAEDVHCLLWKCCTHIFYNVTKSNLNRKRYWLSFNHLKL